MLETLTDLPDSWEDFVLFPARFVVYAPHDVRLALHTFGKTLYRLILCQSGAVNTGTDASPVRHEVEALLAELVLIHGFCKRNPAFERAGEHLVPLLELGKSRFLEVTEECPRAFQQQFPPAIRPFLETRLDRVYLRSIADLGEILRRLCTEVPSLPELASALVFDLRWVGRVLAEHVAVRASVASLDSTDTHLASLADDLAREIRHSIAELIKAGGEG